MPLSFGLSALRSAICRARLACFDFLEQDAATPTLKSVVALLKLGDWDPDVFYKFRDTILNQVCLRAARRSSVLTSARIISIIGQRRVLWVRWNLFFETALYFHDQTGTTVEWFKIRLSLGCLLPAVSRCTLVCARSVDNALRLASPPVNNVGVNRGDEAEERSLPRDPARMEQLLHAGQGQGTLWLG